ncbi:uncharacterized protein cubi_00820 [Cryptosporidium ubiquitum]|uniref:Uncharacterized protein n=1 Tax=Cryptosporidium ubiquitum TaxID=857276 RepID=A0A1J4MD08_9CRYT|nr:uncharacterized protein cubi_00820 [Cryptosporidium ubiquitum]OII70892.1 hypothetical protein cubi_00820 [Cryptosporidium ubiquitum]
MVVWKRTILFRYIYVIILLGISLIFVSAEEIQNPNESSQISTCTKVSLEKKPGEFLVESSLRFPTLKSLFSWMESLDHFYSAFTKDFETISDSIPPKDEYELHAITMSAYSSVLECFGIINELTVLYKSSILEQDSEMFLESSYLSINGLVQDCLTPCKDLLLKSYIRLHELVFESGKIHSPTSLKFSERIIELYDKIWETLTILLGYTTMIKESQNLTLQNRSEIQKSLESFELKQDNSPSEQLKLNILKRKMVDNNRNENLFNLLLSFFEGNFALTVQIAEMESLITAENKRSISELEESIKNIEKSMKHEEKKEEGSAMQLISILKGEINSRSEILVRQISGSPIYLQKYDLDLSSIFKKLSLKESQTDSNEQHKSDEEIKADEDDQADQNKVE